MAKHGGHNERSRTILLLLYPDNERHSKVLGLLEGKYDYAGILHDRDVEENGEIKKAHWHIVISFGNPKSVKAVAQELEIEERFVQASNSKESAYVYLIHGDHPEKFQYKESDLFGNMSYYVPQALKKLENAKRDEDENISKILEYINLFECKLSYMQLTNWVVEQKLYSCFRRGSSVIHRYLDEHNRYWSYREDGEEEEDWKRGAYI